MQWVIWTLDISGKNIGKYQLSDNTLWKTQTYQFNGKANAVRKDKEPKRLPKQNLPLPIKLINLL